MKLFEASEVSLENCNSLISKFTFARHGKRPRTYLLLWLFSLTLYAHGKYVSMLYLRDKI